MCESCVVCQFAESMCESCVVCDCHLAEVMDELCDVCQFAESMCEWCGVYHLAEVMGESMCVVCHLAEVTAESYYFSIVSSTPIEADVVVFRLNTFNTVFCCVCAARRDSGGPGVSMDNPMLQLLLKWCRTVCLHYGVKVTMETFFLFLYISSRHQDYIMDINFCPVVL